MLQGTYLLLLVLAHAALVAALVGGFRTRTAPTGALVVVAAMLAMLLFVRAAFASLNVVTITDSGGRVVTQQTALGWYAYAMIFVTLILAVVAALAWLQTWRDPEGVGNVA
jgi:hypothetical protein